MISKIQHYEGLNRTPAVAILVEGWHDLLREGHAEDSIILHWEQNALVAVDGVGSPIGVLAYEKQPGYKQWWVALGYVRPVYRHMGVYRGLWGKLVQMATEQNVRTIAGSASIRNNPMQQIATRLERPVSGVTFTFRVPEKGAAAT